MMVHRLVIMLGNRLHLFAYFVQHLAAVLVIEGLYQRELDTTGTVVPLGIDRRIAPPQRTQVFDLLSGHIHSPTDGLSIILGYGAVNNFEIGVLDSVKGQLGGDLVGNKNALAISTNLSQQIAEKFYRLSPGAAPLPRFLHLLEQAVGLLNHEDVRQVLAALVHEGFSVLV